MGAHRVGSLQARGSHKIQRSPNAQFGWSMTATDEKRAKLWAVQGTVQGAGPGEGSWRRLKKTRPTKEQEKCAEQKNKNINKKEYKQNKNTQ